MYRCYYNTCIYSIVNVFFYFSHGLRTGIFEASKLVLINFAPTLPELQVRDITRHFLFLLSCFSVLLLPCNNFSVTVELAFIVRVLQKISFIQALRNLKKKNLFILFFSNFFFFFLGTLMLLQCHFTSVIELNLSNQRFPPRQIVNNNTNDNNNSSSSSYICHFGGFKFSLSEVLK